jgi:plastocyanin
MRHSFALAFCFAAACGGGSSTPTPDAPASDVQVVSCGAAAPKETITVTAVPFAYSPATSTINVGDVVHFMVTSSHPTDSGTGGTADGKFTVQSDSCLKFTKAGTYPFFCAVHGFTGTLTVQ